MLLLLLYYYKKLKIIKQENVVNIMQWNFDERLNMVSRLKVTHQNQEDASDHRAK